MKRKQNQLHYINYTRLKVQSKIENIKVNIGYRIFVLETKLGKLVYTFGLISHQTHHTDIQQYT